MKKRTLDPWVRDRLREAVPVIGIILFVVVAAFLTNIVMPRLEGMIA